MAISFKTLKAQLKETSNLDDLTSMAGPDQPDNAEEAHFRSIHQIEVTTNPQNDDAVHRDGGIPVPGFSEEDLRSRRSMSESVELNEGADDVSATYVYELGRLADELADLVVALQTTHAQPETFKMIHRGLMDVRDHVLHCYPTIANPNFNLAPTDTDEDGDTDEDDISMPATSPDQSDLDYSGGFDESFKPGGIKFNDGTSSTIASHDAEILNKFYTKITESNQKQFMSRIHKSSDAYKDVLTFAKSVLGV